MTPVAARRRAIWQIIFLGAGFFVLIAVSALTAFLVERARDQSNALIKALYTDNHLSDLQLELRRAENSRQFFLLTGASGLLAEYARALQQVPESLDRLAETTARNPAQLQRTNLVKELVNARLQSANEALALTTDESAETQALTRDLITKAGSTSVARQHIEAMRQFQEIQIMNRRSQLDRTQMKTTYVAFSGSALLIFLAGCSVLLARNSLRIRDFAAAKLRHTNEDLETAVSERTAALQEANTEIQRFAHIVSHDLRSPLVNVMGFTNELERIRKLKFSPNENPETRSTDSSNRDQQTDQQISDSFAEAVEVIRSSVKRMDRLIGAILQVTRDGRRVVHAEPIETNAVITNIIATLSHQITQANATVTVGNLPDITSDLLSIEQIFSNLLDNALKFLDPNRPGIIEVTAFQVQSTAVFEVKDNGRGIAQQDQQRVFELFRRVGKQDTRGQGIGLAHTRSLVRKLGGTISVQSELNVGCTFKITLPVVYVAQD